MDNVKWTKHLFYWMIVFFLFEYMVHCKLPIHLYDLEHWQIRSTYISKNITWRRSRYGYDRQIAIRRYFRSKLSTMNAIVMNSMSFFAGEVLESIWFYHKSDPHLELFPFDGRTWSVSDVWWQNAKAVDGTHQICSLHDEPN